MSGSVAASVSEEAGCAIYKRGATLHSLPREHLRLLLLEHVEALRAQVHHFPGVCRVKVDIRRLLLAWHRSNPGLELCAEPPLLVLELAGSELLLHRSLLEVEDEEEGVDVEFCEAFLPIVLC